MNRKVFLLPIAMLLIFPITFIITYTIAVKSGHVPAGFPYISDTGTYPPESCIFGQLLNIGAMLAVLVLYIRYRQIYELCTHYSMPNHLFTMNTATLWIGFLMALGISLVGNFQETSVIVVHMIGAMLAFGLGTVYFFMQTIISYYLIPNVCSRLMCHCRLLISILCGGFFIGTFAFATIASKYFEGENIITDWSSDMKGFGYHLASTISEWLMSAMFCIYIATFTREFQDINVTTPQVRIVLANINIQINNPKIEQGSS